MDSIFLMRGLVKDETNGETEDDLRGVGFKAAGPCAGLNNSDILFNDR